MPLSRADSRPFPSLPCPNPAVFVGGTNLPADQRNSSPEMQASVSDVSLLRTPPPPPVHGFQTVIDNPRFVSVVTPREVEHSPPPNTYRSEILVDEVGRPGLVESSSLRPIFLFCLGGRGVTGGVLAGGHGRPLLCPPCPC